ncbi:MAG: tetratricopeptide repeat protein [bacterium]|nr:tetratricopeptide repeat protein [bacterium]
MKWLLLILGICWGNNGLQASPPDLRPAYEAYSAAQSGPDQLQDERLGRALAVFEAALAQESNAVLWVDLGRLHEEAGQPALALHSYLKALKLDPSIDAASAGAQRLETQLGQPPHGFSLFYSLGRVPLWVWGLGLWVAAAWAFWAGLKRRNSWALGWGLLACLFLVGLSQSAWRPLWPGDYLTIEASGLREGPGMEFSTVEPVAAGTKLAPKELVGRWAAIERGDKTLWLPLAVLRRI